jgi:hypothetical protein
LNPWHHAQSSAARYGGEPNDYLELHQWFDESKAFLPDLRHRALRHHAEGIFMAERLFGPVIRNSSGRDVPTRFVGEQHVKEDLGRIPTVQDWLSRLVPAPWMLRSGECPDVVVAGEPSTPHSPNPADAPAECVSN